MLLIDTRRWMLADAQPVQHVGHQLLEAHVLHAGHALGAREVLLGAVAALLALARVVDEELGHLAERAPLLAEVDDQPRRRRPARRGCTPRWRGPGRAGRCRCRSRTRRSRCTRRARARSAAPSGSARCADVAEHVDGLAADRRQEHLEVAARDQLGEHAAGLLEQRAAQLGLGAAEALARRRAGTRPARCAALVTHRRARSRRISPSDAGARPRWRGRSRAGRCAPW